MKLRNHEHSSQSGLESDRRPKIKWHDQNDPAEEEDSGSLKVISKSSNIPDIIPSIEHLDEHAASIADSENTSKNRTSSVNSDKQRLINSMKRQKSILKNKSEDSTTTSNNERGSAT